MKLIYSILSTYYSLVFVQAVCKNNCSAKGVCLIKDNTCSCEMGYFEPDCSIKGVPLQKEVPFTTSCDRNCYLYHVFSENNLVPQKIYFKYHSHYDCRIEVQISQQEENKILDEKSAFIKQKQTVSFELSSELQNIGNILSIQIHCYVGSTLTIAYGIQIQDDSSSLSSLDVFLMALCISFGAAIIIIVLAFCYLIIKKQRKKQNQNHTQPKATPDYLQQNHITPQLQTFQMNSDEECPICLQNLLNGIPAVITPCQHKFHRNCLLEFVIRKQSCPNCRQTLQARDCLNEIFTNNEIIK